MVMTEKINIFPDNAFFEDSQDEHPRGGSWDGEVDGMKATYGAIEPETEATYSIEGREVIFVESGAVSISFMGDDGQEVIGSHNTGDMFELPIGRDFTLKTHGDEKFVYTCIYPDAE